MEIRVATILDVPGIADIAAIIDPLPDDDDVDRGYYTYLAKHGRLLVAETSDAVIGYAGTVTVAGTCHLSDLFVHPDAHGKGIGSALLDAVWDADAATVPRQTFSSLHPSALPLYLRSGMTARWPLLYLRGRPDALPPTHLKVLQIDASRAVALELSWLGWARPEQYAYLSSIRGARVMAVLDGEAPVGVGVVTRRRMTHTLQRLASCDRSVMPDALIAVARWVREEMQVAVPGDHRTVPLLVEAGWQVMGHDLYCASAPNLLDADRLLPHPGLL